MVIGSALKLSAKKAFILGIVLIENYGLKILFNYSTYSKKKTVFEVLRTPIDQTNYFCIQL